MPSPTPHGIAALADSVSYAELLGIERPAQYLGGEVNAVVKEPKLNDVRLALAFPDSYEVGMSHAGLQLLYQIGNSVEHCWTERVFMPLPDMEALLRTKKSHLFSLESATPLTAFDLLGFTLQYELTATNVLAMLELGGIPLPAADRQDGDPVILGGGSYAMHGAALAPFFDFFFLGEAEQGLLEIIDLVRAHKAQHGRSKRQELLRKLADVEGVLPARALVTGVSESSSATAKRRTLPTLNGQAYINRPVMPHSKTIHDRLSVELMRGCVRGCRFCQAGFLYRPHRERAPDEVVGIIKEALSNTGFEELGLLSLSTADYCSLSPLLEQIMDAYADQTKLSVSLPSTRIDAVRPDIMQQIARVRRTGFTLAPEGGSQRLRQVINKGISEEDILTSCSQVFEAGWESIKLYFMIGLPTETDEDLHAIVELASKIKNLPAAKGRSITVSASTFVPKPHTPFQWAEQIRPEEARRRQDLIKSGLRRHGIAFRYQKAFTSMLEGLLARADSSFADIVVEAYTRGARFDAWDEYFRQDIWHEVLEEFGIDIGQEFSERALDTELPWSTVQTSVSASYLKREWHQARQGRPTESCLTASCSNCGVCADDLENIRFPTDKPSPDAAKQPTEIPAGEPAAQRIRLSYAKRGVYAMVSHLEFAGVFQRCCRRAGIPLAYSGGFHPLPRVVFGPPLQLGIPSSSEYVDLYLAEAAAPDLVFSCLQEALPNGIVIHSAEAVRLNAPAISAQLASQKYALFGFDNFSGFPDPQDPSNTITSADRATTDLVDSMLQLEVVRNPPPANPGRGRKRKAKKPRRFTLSEHLSSLDLYPQSENSRLTAEFTLSFQPQRAAPKPFEIAAALTGRGPLDYWIEKTHAELRPADDIMD